MARISGCEEIRGEAELQLPRGSGSLAGTQACTLMSSVPVAVGVRQEPLSAVPELAHLVPSPGIPVSPGPVTPAPPVEPVPAPPAAGARELLPPIPSGIPMIALPAGQFEMGCRPERDKSCPLRMQPAHRHRRLHRHFR